MSAATDIDLAVRDGRRRRVWAWVGGVVAVLVVIGVAVAWAWSDRLYLMDDYRAGWNTGQASAPCVDLAQRTYPQADWQGDRPVGSGGRSARAFLTGCLEAGDGSRFAPWHVATSD